MKKLLLTLLVALPLISLAQSFKADDSIVSAYTDQPAHLLDTVVVSALTKSQLYSNALNYLTSTFKDSRSVVEMKDLELGEIAFRGTIIDENVNLYFKCRVYAKENKFKILLSGLEYGKPIPGLTPYNNQLRTANKNYDPEENKMAREMAVNLIKDIANKVNKRPENDF